LPHLRRWSWSLLFVLHPAEHFEQALEDLENALDLAHGIYGPRDRRVAEAYFTYGCALGYANRHDKATECLNQAIEILRTRLAELERLGDADASDSVKSELADLRDLIPDIESKVMRFWLLYVSGTCTSPRVLPSADRRSESSADSEAVQGKGSREAVRRAQRTDQCLGH
jgi:tetratricopeptide (TPR) repeat protein